MELISLVIMVLGLLALVAIYVISRLSRRNLPQKRDENVPVLRDADGNDTSSVLDDVAARDGKRPASNARHMSDAMMSGINEPHAAHQENTPIAKTAQLPPQLILFIAADTEMGFQGNTVLKALEKTGLYFGEMDIFHRYILTENGEASLFSIANGVKPWTLIPEELVEETTPGLSLILDLPSLIDESDAIRDFLHIAERLTAELGGVLKDQNQQPVTIEYRNALLALVS